MQTSSNRIGDNTPKIVYPAIYSTTSSAASAIKAATASGDDIKTGRLAPFTSAKPIRLWGN